MLPLLHPRDVCLWAIDLDTVLSEESCLSVEEHRRADRLLQPADRHRFRAAHSALRILLGRHLGAEPAHLCFIAGTNGRPTLDPEALDFSLAHSGPYALVGVAPRGPIGVDIEERRGIENAAQVARDHLSAAEAAAVSASAMPAETLLVLWTLKEAVTKATGEGLRQRFRSFTVELTGPGEAALASSEPDSDAWSLRTLAPFPQAVAAVASRRPIGHLHCWRYPQAGRPAPT